MISCTCQPARDVRVRVTAKPKPMAPLVFLAALAVAAGAAPGADIVSGDANQLRQVGSRLPVCKCAAIWYDRAECPTEVNYGCPKEPCDKSGGNRQCNVQESPCSSDALGQGFIDCDSDTPVAEAQCNPDPYQNLPDLPRCMDGEFVLEIVTSTMKSAETITDPGTRSGFGGAHVSFEFPRHTTKTRQGWTDKQTFLSDSAQKGEHVIFKFRLSEWPEKIEIIGRGQDAWGYDSIRLSNGDDKRWVLKPVAEGGTPTPDMCETCEHWVGGNRDTGVPLEHTYVIPRGSCAFSSNRKCGPSVFPPAVPRSPPGFECAESNCKDSECCITRAVCSDFTCPANYDGKAWAAPHGDITCAGGTCDRDECCKEHHETCSQSAFFTCPANYEGKSDSANFVCAGTSCDRDECCKESYPVKCTSGWYGNAQCHGEVTGCKKANVFTRSRGEYCEKGSQAIIKTFVPHTTSTADAEQVRNDCEAFCEGTDGCWGCSVSFVWNAIPSCGNLVTWSGKIKGDVSQNPNVEETIMTADTQELDRVRAERDSALTRMADIESELLALKATKEATSPQEVAPATALAAQEHEPSSIVVAGFAGVAVALVALISLGLAMKSFGLVLKAKDAQPARASLITDNE